MVILHFSFNYTNYLLKAQRCQSFCKVFIEIKSRYIFQQRAQAQGSSTRVVTNKAEMRHDWILIATERKKNVVGKKTAG